MPFVAGPLPPARRMLVFAPHPDDEIFGCAGTLALYVAQKASIQVVVVSDGGAQVGIPDRQRHAAERAQESRSALASLGVEMAEFWGLSDRSLYRDADLPLRIARAIEEGKPDLVMAPSLWEIHPDHVAVARAVLGAAHASQAPPRILFYEVGAAQRVNLLLDITAVWDLKCRAMACFASQLERQDYMRHIEALNTWRTYTLPSHVRQAEGFTCVEPADLKRLDAPDTDPTAVFARLAHDAVLLRAGAHQEALRQQLIAGERAYLEAVQGLGEREGLVEGLRADLELSRQDVASKATTILGLEADLSRSETQLAALATEVSAARSDLMLKDAALRERDEALVVKDAALRARDEALVVKDAALRERDEALVALESNLRQVLQDRAELEVRLQHTQAVVADLQDLQRRIFQSTSWRLTSPLRWLKRQAGKALRRS